MRHSLPSREFVADSVHVAIFGSAVCRVPPDAVPGEPIAPVRKEDEIDIPDKRFSLSVSEPQLQRRLTGWQHR